MSYYVRYVNAVVDLESGDMPRVLENIAKWAFHSGYAAGVGQSDQEPVNRAPVNRVYEDWVKFLGDHFPNAR